jgi:hypothetical protein
MPELLRRVDERLDELPDEPDALVRLELVDVEDRRDAELEQPLGQEAGGAGIRRGVAAVARGQDVVELLAEGRELALGVDDQVLDVRRASARGSGAGTTTSRRRCSPGRGGACRCAIAAIRAVPSPFATA